MHKSRLGTIVIDCQTEDLDSAAEFWAKALGWASADLSDPNNATYRKLITPADQVAVLVQAVSHTSQSTWISKPTTSTPKFVAWRHWARNASPK